jgi:hypothetical protein
MRRNVFKSLLLMSLICLTGASSLAAKSADTEPYTTRDKEFYLSPELMLFVRPGLELEIQNVEIPADRRAEVTFRITDPAGLPLDRNGLDTLGPVSTSFILAYIPESEESYVSYTSRIQTSPITGDSAEQASADSGGAYTDLGDGTYRYKFGTILPENYDTNATHSLGIYARRDLTEFDLDRYVANELEHFVPSGASIPVPRDIVTTETCNGRCHDPLAIHGGARTEVGLCVLCHNPSQGIDPDTGNSVDFPLMIHKIHMGENLANGYTIIGYRQSVHDYSHVVYPAPINECETCHTGGIPTENFPVVATPSAALVCDISRYGETLLTWESERPIEIRVRAAGAAESTLFAWSEGSGSQATGKWIADGTTFEVYDADSMQLIQELPVNATVLGCTGNAPGAPVGVAGAQHTNWLDHTSRQACETCHDYINWETGEGHSDFDLAMFDDASCDKCHQPESGPEFYRTIRGAHLSPYQSAQFPGVLVDLKEVIDTNPGDNPTVIFSVSNKNGRVNPNELNRMRLTLSGPNDDFSFRAQETVGGSAIWVADNTWSYTFSTALPEDAFGSYTVSTEARDLVEVDFGDGPVELRDTAENPLLAFAVTDPAPVPRRMVVDDAKCETCHSNLAFHGGNRHDPSYCNTCHMPDALDRDGEQTISFKYMIHSIHRGADLENGFAIGSHDYSEVEFPGDLRNCDACHVNNSQQVPLPAGLLSTTTPQSLWSPLQPQTAACLSCHDGDDTANHAFDNVAFFGESCGTCHGEGRIAAVDKVHAR